MILSSSDNVRVECGHDKWSIEYDADGAALVISFYKHPIYGDISLGDLSVDDINNLADFFNKIAGRE